MRVVVVGAGIVGLCTALALRREGAEVIVLDRATTSAGASAANAGWVVPVLAAPLSGPGVLGEVTRATLRGAGSVGVRPTAGLLGWTLGFLRASDADRHRAGLRAILDLGAHSVELFATLRDSGVAFEMHRRGLLIAARTPHGLQTAHELVDTARSAGYRGDVHTRTGSAVRALEPALAESILGVVHAREDAHVRPESVLVGLRAALHAEGGTLADDTAVRGLERVHTAWAVGTARGVVSADRVVIAAGAASARLLRDLGTRVPLLGGKGYSVTAHGTGTAPAHPIKLLEANLACSPFETGLRISGMFELGAAGEHLRRAAQRRIRAGAARYLRDWQPAETGTALAGLRPVTPDSLPLIGPVPGCDGVFAATGHGTLGLTLAPATAAALATLILHGRPRAELTITPFAVDRFARHAAARASARPGWSGKSLQHRTRP